MRSRRPAPRRILFLGIFLLATLASARRARADVVVTIDGTTYEGKVLVEDDKEVVILTTFDGRKSIPRANVAKVDRSPPPLRDQLKFRAERAKDSVKALWDLHKWAKQKGFEKELALILERIIELDPKSARAHKLLGHEKVDGVWMTPEEREALERLKYEEAMRAKGLVPYQGRWVTPEEKHGLENGLLKDGDEWVTVAEYHARRGEKLVDGKWVRVGEDEGKAWQEALKKNRVKAAYLWGANFDLYSDVSKENAKKVLKGCEAVLAVMRRTLRPSPGEMPRGLDARIRLHAFKKLPAYARFAVFFDKQEKCSELVVGWVRSVQRQHAFWWVQPVGVVAAYKFPNTSRTLVSNLAHDVGMILLTQYRFNYRFPSQWLLDGFAYYLELEGMGYTETFSLSRGGSAAAGDGSKPVWLDSAKWSFALKGLVTEGRDPPIKRIAKMTQDQMGYHELAKSWSVVEYLIRKDQAAFKRFIDADKERDKTTEDALKEAYGLTWRKLDQAWRAYVAADFKIPGAGGETGGS
ncbi:MAG: hypothetical protein ACC662_04670 [Planctomycetota bacterium]